MLENEMQISIYHKYHHQSHLTHVKWYSLHLLDFQKQSPYGIVREKKRYIHWPCLKSIIFMRHFPATHYFRRNNKFTQR